MRTIYIKEIRSFLSSFIAYIVIVVFLIANGLFMWVFEDTNVLDFGYANMDTLFELSPWILMFLVSAITMRSFSEEKKVGTIETLTTKPISDLSIILGKFFAGFTLVLFSLLPTIIYFYSIYQLGETIGNIDTGATLGSYLGLLMLGGVYVAIGIFASAITENQIVSFVLSLFVCFVFYMAFDYLGNLEVFKGTDFFLEWIGINYHYRSISKGILDTRDVIYFLSLTGLFIWLTKIVFESRKW